MDVYVHVRICIYEAVAFLKRRQRKQEKKIFLFTKNDGIYSHSIEICSACIYTLITYYCQVSNHRGPETNRCSAWQDTLPR